MASNRGLKSCLVFRKAVMCLTEGQVFKKLCLGMSYSAIGHEFDVNGATTYIE